MNFNGEGVKLKNQHARRGLFELTYRCNIDCVHCYCKGSEDLEAELTAGEAKGILEQLYGEGCLEVAFTGGEPLIREDFTEIYLYAKRKGFIIDLFTNGILLSENIISFFQKFPPRSIEITLNGITEKTYESITRVKGSFKRVISVINRLVERDMPLVIKANCLRQNKDEITKIKAFASSLFKKAKKRFKFDPHIYPRLDGDRLPCKYRLSPSELNKIAGSDTDISAEWEEMLKSEHSLSRTGEFIYQCDSWMSHFFINPYGRLKFCQFTEDFSTDLREKPFKDGFYGEFPKLLEKKFKSSSRCKSCKLRPFCLRCPGRAYIETRDDEAPVPYFCELAKARAADRKELLNR